MPPVSGKFPAFVGVISIHLCSGSSGNSSLTLAENTSMHSLSKYYDKSDVTLYPLSSAIYIAADLVIYSFETETLSPNMR
nr:MAG TPA: hypothetical protein [Bacteriophage sp.]